MPKLTPPTEIKNLRHDIRALQQRVKWLESALKPKSGKPVIDRTAANLERGTAESAARSKALQEYGERESYLNDPRMLELTLEIERKRNDFLKSRGFEPEPSIIPAAIRRRAKRRL